MKTLYITLVLTFFGCHNQTKETVQTIDSAATSQGYSIKKTDNSKYHTAKDTIFIPTAIGDTLKYGKNDFNKLVDNHPEFFYEFSIEPDYAYHYYGNNAEFGSEVGQDNYYALYAYFLKQKNGVANYAAQRKKLIAIYSNINSLFGHLEYGGTYFGHQAVRILGYAEYSIYLLSKTKGKIEKTYDITNQKALYIKSLQQLIRDENQIDFITLGDEKIKRSKELNKITSELDNLITDIYYLRQAQEFQYTHYQYY